MDQYVDAVIGSDANDGSAFAPKKTYAAARAAMGGNGAHRALIRNGQTHLTTANASALGGLSAAARSQVLTYGDGPKARISPAWAPGSNTSLWWQLSAGGGFITIDGIVFDALGDSRFSNAMSLGINGAQDMSDIVIRQCEFTGAVVGFEAGHTSGLTWAAQRIIGARLERCDAYGNARHGFYKGGFDTVYYRCRAFRNGGKDGGHGFSSQGQQFTTVSSGWTLVSGTIYNRAVSPDAVGVWTNHGTYKALVQNTATPTSPAAGEWGVAGGALYVNCSVDPATLQVTFVQIPQGNVYERCEAFENYAFAPYPFIEGSGFQSDDFTTGNVYRRCVSHNNSGGGFSFNNSSSGRIESGVAYGNATRGLGIQNTSGVQVIGYTGLLNNAGGVRYPADLGLSYPGDQEEVGMFSSPGVSLRALALQCRVGLPGAILVNDSRSALAASGNDIMASGAAAIFYGTGGSLTGAGNSVAADLKVGPDGRPSIGSPLLTGALNASYRRDFANKQARKFIGAYGAATLRRLL